MTTISNITGQTGGSAASDAPRPAVNVSDAAHMENTFMTLMTALIANQDPTKPMDSNEFLSQFPPMPQVKSMQNMAALARNNMILTDSLQTLAAAGPRGQDAE